MQFPYTLYIRTVTHKCIFNHTHVYTHVYTHTYTHTSFTHSQTATHEFTHTYTPFEFPFPIGGILLTRNFEMNDLSNSVLAEAKKTSKRQNKGLLYSTALLLTNWNWNWTDPFSSESSDFGGNLKCDCQSSIEYSTRQLTFGVY